MTIQLSPEQEHAIQEAINRGLVRSVEEFIDVAISMLPQARDRTGYLRHANAIHADDERLTGTREFLASKSLSELARAQGVKPLEDPSVLIGGWPDDEDLDEFLEMTYKERDASLMKPANGRSPA